MSASTLPLPEISANGLLLTPALRAQFAQAMAQLNDRQRQAVTHGDGPMLVVAGPGTGKTQLLATRVAWLLHREDGPRPSEILCLTYTNAAVRNMRQRLLSIIGPAAHLVSIYTFHSFGQLIIQENSNRLGVRGLEVASEAEARKFYVDLVESLPADHALYRDTGNTHYEIERLEPSFRLMKKEGWTASQFVEALEKYRTSLAESPDYRYKVNLKDRGIKKGDINEKKLADEIHYIKQSAAAAELFAPFQQVWQKAGRYDYDDMMGWSLKLLTDHETVRQHYQEQYQYFLVDEYQDTNGAQNQLLQLVSESVSRPNVLVVGDDDQSIFRFQGASVANVLGFHKRYSDVALVVLEENYRSSAQVLAMASNLIALNQERLSVQLPGLTKTLVARHPQFAASKVQPLIRCYASPLHEVAHVADELAALHQAGIPAGGCAVLAHDHDQLHPLAQLLAANGVPYYRARQVNVLTEETLATSLHRVLQYVARALRQETIFAEPDLFALLHLECFAIPPVDVVRLAASYQQQFPRGAEPYPWREWLDDAANDEDVAMSLRLTTAGRQALGRALPLLDAWVQAGATQPVNKVVELILQNTLLPWQVTHYSHPAHQHIVARTLLRFVREESIRQPMLTVAGMLAAWAAQSATRNGLPLERTTGTENAGVQLLTAHSAKGLEFERVWVLGCQQSAWLKRAHTMHYRLPPELVPTPVAGSDKEEARRLFFVALTRAQEHLTMSFATHNDQAEATPECQFVSELVAHGLSTIHPAVSVETVQRAQQQLHAPVPLPGDVPGSDTLEAILDDFVLSATTLNAYLKCPIGCYYEHLLRVPAARNEAMIFGSAVHHALEKYFRQMHEHEHQEFGSAEDLAKAFEVQLWRDRAELEPATYERRRKVGRRFLLQFHAHYHPHWLPTSVVEYRVERAILPSGLPLTGAMDRLDPDPVEGHHLIDYKTGNPKYVKEHFAPAKGTTNTLAEWHQDEKARGGKYWRQAVFYHLLLKHDVAQRYKLKSVSFQFIQPKEDKGQAAELQAFPVDITPEGEAIVLAQIEAVDAAIRRHDFTHGCGECDWCKMRRGNLATSFTKRPTK
jgi:DNA helicase-2/ATP-dependent DNA helicase PcrA